VGAARPRVDLHTHSTASDGTDTPAELMVRAGEAGLDVVALTDHDTTAGWGSAAAALPQGLTLVPGLEISCVSTLGGRSVSLHLLAYLVNPDHPPLAAELAALRESRLGRGEEMVRRLRAAGHPVTWSRVEELAAGGSVGRPHVARALMDAGLVPSVEAAFRDEWIGHGGRYWVPKVDLDPVHAVRLVAEAGGVSVFAHPLASARGPVVGEEVIEAMAEAGLGGIEVDHPEHAPEARRRAAQIAVSLGLLATGSSDYHGTSKPQGLGAETTDPGVYAALVDRGTGSAPVRG